MKYLFWVFTHCLFYPIWLAEDKDLAKNSHSAMIRWALQDASKHFFRMSRRSKKKYLEFYSTWQWCKTPTLVIKWLWSHEAALCKEKHFLISLSATNFDQIFICDLSFCLRFGHFPLATSAKLQNVFSSLSVNSPFIRGHVNRIFSTFDHFKKKRKFNNSYLWLMLMGRHFLPISNVLFMHRIHWWRQLKSIN